MRDVVGQGGAHPLSIDLDSADTESLTSSVSRDDLQKSASSLSQSAAAQPEPTMEIRASLGELALFVSGRPSEVWWPPEHSEVRIQSLFLKASCCSCHMRFGQQPNSK